jgi:transposase
MEVTVRMGRHQKRPLRPLTESEIQQLTDIASSKVERVERIRRARAILAVSKGQSFTGAAKEARMRSNSGIAAIVQRFHDRGMGSLNTVPGAGRRPVYDHTQRNAILLEIEKEMERTSFWSLSTLENALKRSTANVPKVSAKTICQVLKDAGYAWLPNEHVWSKNGPTLAETYAAAD